MCLPPAIRLHAVQHLFVTAIPVVRLSISNTRDEPGGVLDCLRKCGVSPYYVSRAFDRFDVVLCHYPQDNALVMVFEAIWRRCHTYMLSCTPRGLV